MKRKRKPIPINPETGLPYSKGTMKMRLLKRLKCTQKFEKLAWAAGAKLVAGVDEVGRGCLFGPVVAGAVILEPGYRIKGLRDSKLLDQKTRERLAERIKQHARRQRVTVFRPVGLGVLLLPAQALKTARLLKP